MQFWTISTSCLGVLISIYCILQNSSKNYVSFSLSKIQNLKFNIICLVFYIGIACVSLMTESSTGKFILYYFLGGFLIHSRGFTLYYSQWITVIYQAILLCKKYFDPKFWINCMFFHPCTGFLVIIKIFWFLLHGLASVGVIWHLICTFPFCLSIGTHLFTYFFSFSKH